MEAAGRPRPVLYCAHSGTGLPRGVLLQPAQCLPLHLPLLASRRKTGVWSILRDIAPYRPTRTGELGLRDAKSESGGRGNQRVELMNFEDAQPELRAYLRADRLTCLWSRLLPKLAPLVRVARQLPWRHFLGVVVTTARHGVRRSQALVRQPGEANRTCRSLATTRLCIVITSLKGQVAPMSTVVVFRRK